jgi:hypothetical protein
MTDNDQVEPDYDDRHRAIHATLDFYRLLSSEYPESVGMSGFLKDVDKLARYYADGELR